MTVKLAAFSSLQFQAASAVPAHARGERTWQPDFAGECLQLVTTRAGFDALEADWNALFERAGRGEQMFQTFNWLWHWANHFMGDAAGSRAKGSRAKESRAKGSLAIVTVRRAGLLVAVLPMAVERAAGLRHLVFMGAPVSQYGDALVDHVPDVEGLLARALQFAIDSTGADVVRLAKVRADAVMAPVLATMGAVVTATEEAPYVAIAGAGSAAHYERRFSSKNLKNRRRLLRRLEERGVMDFAWDISGQSGAEAATTALVLKRAWLKTRGRLSRAFADGRTDRFFAAVCQGDIRPAGATVSLLTSGGEIANAGIAITVKGRQALHILAYGLKFEKCAAGVLHVEAFIRRAFDTGVHTFDFLAPRHDYKLEWADGAISVADYALPVSPLGRAYTRIYLGFVRERLKTLVNDAPRGWSKCGAVL